MPPFTTSALSDQPFPPSSSIPIKNLPSYSWMVKSSIPRKALYAGRPLAMPMYAVDTLPLIKRFPNLAMQVWYADDASALGTITNLRECWENLARMGLGFEYFPNPSKTWLVMKVEYFSKAAAAFEGTRINITMHLRATIPWSCFRHC